ncbi:MAG: hypothetical protein LBT41_02075 [Candidatus Methanoplasma sp.]|nr:hypothetical protein [Candidatus Methanoplasma sp.]
MVRSGDGIETHGFGVKDLKKLLADARKSLGPAGMDRFQERIAFVRSRLSGRSVAESSRSAGISVRSGYNIQAVWNKYGPKGLYPNFAGGRKPKMSAQQLVQFHNEYHKRGMSANESREYIKEEFGIEYSQKQIYLIIAKVSSKSEEEIRAESEKRREAEEARNKTAAAAAAHRTTQTALPSYSAPQRRDPPARRETAPSPARTPTAPSAQPKSSPAATDRPTAGRSAPVRPAAASAAYAPIPAAPKKAYERDIDAGRALLGKRQTHAATPKPRPETEMPSEAPVEQAKPVAPVAPVAPTANSGVGSEVVRPVEVVIPEKPVASVAPVATPIPAKPVAPVEIPIPAKPVAPVANSGVGYGAVRPVEAAKPVAPVAPVEIPIPAKPVAPVAPVATAIPAKPVAPVANSRVGYWAVRPVETPIPAKPVAPVEIPIPAKPVAPIPAKPVAPVANSGVGYGAVRPPVETPIPAKPAGPSTTRQSLLMGNLTITENADPVAIPEATAPIRNPAIPAKPAVPGSGAVQTAPIQNAAAVEAPADPEEPADGGAKTRDMSSMMKNWSRDAVKKAAKTRPKIVVDETGDIMKLEVPDLSAAEILISEDRDAYVAYDDGLESYDCVFRAKPLRKKEDIASVIARSRLRFAKKP